MKVFISNFPDTSAMPQLNSALTRIQLCYIPDSTFLMVEDWDWLVVLQCLQDHNLFKSHPQRPPLSDFETWLNDSHIPHLSDLFLNDLCIQHLCFLHHRHMG